MTAAEAIELGIAANVAVWICLVLLVSLRKHRRDVREHFSSWRRKRNGDALWRLTGPELEPLLREAIASPAAQTDLLATLNDEDLVSEIGFARLRQIAIETGFGEWLARQSRSADPVERGRAALLAGRLRLPQATAIAVPMLDDEDADVRLVACAALERDGSARSARALIDAIEAGRVPAPRLIERLGGWARGEVLRALHEPRPSHVRVALIRALGLAADPAAAVALVPYLVDGEEEQRVSAARSLGEIGAREATEALTEALDDPLWTVRAQAAKALGKIGDPHAAVALEAHVADDAWWVRANAANALRALGPDGIGTLRRIERTSDDRYARDRAREALALAGMGSVGR